MLKSKITLVFILFSVWIGFELNRIYVPANFEKPMSFRIFVTGFRIIAGLVDI